MYRNKIIASVTDKPKEIEIVSTKNPHLYFGNKLFSDAVQKERLPKEVYKKLKKTIDERSELDPQIAESVAVAMRDWAVEQGASHYTHWFQPLTGATAEKHDGFFAPQSEGSPILDFSGKQLVKGEPDASSFPSGGLRSTFEARGYTAWDPTSPAFVLSTKLGSTLFIPTVYCSYSGESLDSKTPLLRSQEVLSSSATRLLKILGRKVTKVYTTIGLEQEFFLIDSAFYNQRPDLLSSGRTLFGSSPLKGQELADHYFAKIPERVLLFIQESERILCELGVPIKTRHNEVAPQQFEIAPYFEEGSLAVDHNMLMMSVMKEVALKHGLRMLLHEKPFKGMNGSGKHCNWSMCDSEGQNLLDPGDNPHKNMEFMVFLVCLIRAVDRHANLLRVAISSASNDHRLGGHEAPPAIISIFLGEQLQQVIDNILAERTGNNVTKSALKLGVTTLPPLPMDNSDRNRTSPFAFSGNKFEFRALGSKQNASAPNYTLNAAMAESIDFIADAIEKRTSQGQELATAVHKTLHEVLQQHARVIYNGDGYTENWQQEATKRGLPNLLTLVDAMKHFDQPDSVALFEKYGIMTKRELQARKQIRLEKYSTEITIEARSMLELVKTIFFPAALQHFNTLRQACDNAAKMPQLSDMLTKQVAFCEEQILSMMDQVDRLEKELGIVKNNEEEQADHVLGTIKPLMSGLRACVDRLESVVEDKLWPLPKYREMLSIL